MDRARDRYVGLGRRFCAYVLDMCIVLFITALALLLVFSLRSWIPQAVVVLLAVAIFLNGIPVSWLYFAGMESSKFQGTFGKMALGIQVADEEGRRIGFGRASLRFLGKLLNGVTFWIGVLLILFTKKKQGLHDKIASTVVIKKRQAQET